MVTGGVPLKGRWDRSPSPFALSRDVSYFARAPATDLRLGGPSVTD